MEATTNLAVEHSQYNSRNTHAQQRPYRISVFGSRGAYAGWTPVQHYREARLPSSGSFLYPGIHAVRRAAMEYLALPETQQVSIRTNQDRQVYRFFKHVDGRISGYGGAQ